MKRTIFLTLILLLGLQGCTTKTITEYKYLEIPSKYLQCEGVKESFKPSEAAYSGDLKLYLIEYTAYTLKVESKLEACERTAASAREYQEKVK